MKKAKNLLFWKLIEESYEVACDWMNKRQQLL